MPILRLATWMFLFSLPLTSFGFKLLQDVDSGSRWQRFPIEFRISNAALSQGVLDFSEFIAAARAMQTWSHIPGSRLRMHLNPDPFTGTCAQAIAQGINIICFLPNKAQFAVLVTGVEVSQATIAIGGTLSSNAAGELGGGFVLLNEEDHGFRTDSFSPGQTTLFDTEAVLLHELGHVAGLDHSGHSSAVMFANSDANKSSALRVPHEDDIRGMQFLYPAKEALPGVSCGNLSKGFPAFLGGPLVGLLLLCLSLRLPIRGRRRRRFYGLDTPGIV